MLLDITAWKTGLKKTTVDAIYIVRSVIFTKDYDTERSYNIKELIATKEEAEAKLAELKGE